MPKVSFKKTDAPASADPVAAVVEEVQGAGAATSVGAGPASPANTAVAVREATPPPAPYGGDDDIDMKDIKLPFLNIAQKVGELGDKFKPGELVFDISLVLPQPVRFVVLGFAPKAFVEKVKGGGRGQICHTEKEVEEAGGTLDYNEAQVTDKALFQRLAKALIAIQCPEGVDPITFPFDFGDHHYALATWNLKGTGYTKGAKIIFTQRKVGQLRDDSKGGYRARFWNLSTETDSFEKNTYFIPKLRLSDPTTPEFRDWIAGIVGL